MPRVSRSVLLPYSAPEMFALVNDVARYPEFLPFCVGAEVLAETAEAMQARLQFARLGLAQALVTSNRLTPPSRIDIELVEGPFDHLHGEWQFQALGESACKTSFTVDFQVQAVFLQFLAGAALNQAATQTLDAFQRRAVQIYGKR